MALVMGGKSSKTITPNSPLGRLLDAMQPHALMPSLQISTLIRLCSKKWPEYTLEGNCKWPPNSTFDPDILRELSNYCNRTGRWKELSYVSAFFYMALKTDPSVLTDCPPAHSHSTWSNTTSHKLSSPRSPEVPHRSSSRSSHKKTSPNLSF